MGDFKRIVALIRSFFVLVPLVLVGCATTESNIETESEFREVAKDASIVSGRIDWLERGAKKEIGGGMFAMSVAPHLMRIEDKTRIVGEVHKGGRFVWSLEPGTYMIHKMAYRDTWSGNYFVVPKVAFVVPEAGKTYYVGVLECRFEPERDFIGGLSGVVSFKILDEGETDARYLEDKFAITSDDIDNSLMIHDIRLPNTVDTTAEFNLAVSIINALLYGAS
jgi:hypothetical protein